MNKHKHSANDPLQVALQHHQAGRLQQADAIYKKMPGHPDALHLSGLIACETGDHATGIDRINKAIRLNPSSPTFHCSLGLAYRALNRFAEAEACFRKAISRQPNYLDAINHLGNTLYDLSKLDEALACFQKALVLDPNLVDTHNNLGNLFKNQGRLNDAVTCYLQALSLQPNVPELHYNLGNTFERQNKPMDAIACYEKALALRPNYVDALINLGGVLKCQGKLDESVSCCRRVLELEPNAAEAHHNLGVAYKEQGKLDEAVGCFDNALAINPNYAEAYCNLGGTLQEQGKYSSAVACCQKALELKPNYPEAYNNLAIILQSLGKLDEAVAHCKKAIALKPDLVEAYNNLAMTLQSQRKLDDAIACYRHAIKLDSSDPKPQGNMLFCYNYHPTLSAEEIHAAYQRWNEQFAAHLSRNLPPFANTRDAQRRLRIGYVSPDFRNHSVIHFAAPLIELHDKSHFEVFCYYNHFIHDAYTERIIAATDHWIPCRAMSDDQLAQRIRDDGIDVLVDLAGHTAGNRLMVFARKPAPVQVSWIGYGYTTGLTAIDYFIGDPVFTPPGSEALFSETIYRLPHATWAYQPPAAAPAPNALPAKGRGYVTFACLSRSERVNARMIDAWAEILRRVPNARLRLDSRNFGDPTLRADIEARFAAHGISAARLQIGFTSPVWEVYHDVDIVFDCFPHNSGTTTFEALWMGLPVITLADRPSVGRLGASLLNCIGKQQWIATDVTDYINRAIALAGNLDELEHCRVTLRQAMLASPLLDQPSFVRDMEHAFHDMWQQWCKGGAKDNQLLFQTAIAHHQAGRLSEAAAIYQQMPDNPDAIHLLGVIGYQIGKHEMAVGLISKAIAANPTNPDYYCNIGPAYHAMKRLDEAASSYRQALAIKPDYALVHNNLGNVLTEQGKLEEATVSYRQALSLKPDYVDAFNNLGSTQMSLGKTEDAIASFQQALKLMPDFAEAYYNLGNAYRIQGNLNEAISSYQSALRCKPDFYLAHNNLGNALKEQGKFNDAIACFQQSIVYAPDPSTAYGNLGEIFEEQVRLDEAIESYKNALIVKPGDPEILKKLGNALQFRGQFDSAIQSYKKALSVHPDDPEILNNLGNALFAQNKPDEAIQAYRQALLVKPDYAEALCNLGCALGTQGKLDEALESTRKALRIKPDYETALNNLGNVLLARRDLNAATETYQKALTIKTKHTDAHSNMLFCYNYHPTLSAEEIHAAYQRWNEQFAAHLSRNLPPFANTRDAQRRLRIGYVSPDFRNHSVIHFAAPLIELHDKSHFEVFCYYNHFIHDAYTERIIAATDHWIPCRAMSDDQLAQRIRDDGIDVLVDLAGHTAGNRLMVFARKPAPVQVSWIGYGYTTGLTAIDYFIGDPVFTPPGSEALFSETIYRLPHATWAYQPPAAAPAPNALPAKGRGYVTFACLSRSERVNARMIDAWAEILRRVPNARLRLDSRNFGDPTLRADIEARFAAHGISAARLQIGFTSPVWEVYHDVDIVFDCFPHNSGTTTFEALWMGLPVITLADRPSVGRLGASLLNCIGKQQWIATDVTDYINRAIALAGNLDELEHCRVTLRQAMLASPLLDQPSFVRDMEHAFHDMWQQWCKGGAESGLLK